MHFRTCQAGLLRQLISLQGQYCCVFASRVWLGLESAQLQDSCPPADQACILEGGASRSWQQPTSVHLSSVDSQSAETFRLCPYQASGTRLFGQLELQYAKGILRKLLAFPQNRWR